MDKAELLAIYDEQLRFRSTDPLSERQAVPTDGPVVVRHVPLDPRARWGWVIWSRLSETNADQMISEQVAFYKERGQNFEWKRYGYDGPADLDDRLLRHGFSREEHESVMVLDLHAGRPPAPRGEARGSWAGGPCEVRRITDPSGLTQVVEIEDAVWHESHAWIADELRYELLLPDEPMLMYVAYCGGVPAAAAWMRFHKGTDFVALFGGSTLPQYRKRGLYTALLNARAEVARERGYRFLSVDASEMSRPILEKRGFIKITTATAYKYRLPGVED